MHDSHVVFYFDKFIFVAVFPFYAFFVAERVLMIEYLSIWYDFHSHTLLDVGDIAICDVSQIQLWNKCYV